ncbi:MAG: Sepiapterin reductase [Ignavibacteriae bacterium]|nr:MAG: Sepiapterin reductase [Ignavibacteriota bacterium]
MKKKPSQAVVWITGADSGIGQQLAIQFSIIGCNVILSARSVTKLKKTKKIINKLGGEAYIEPLNLSDIKKINLVYRKIEHKFGPVDVLVNNAGITSFKNFQETSTKDFKTILDINLVAPFVLIKNVLPKMIQNNDGWIINILSVTAIKIFKNSAAYTASKMGLKGLTNVLREEIRGHNIKVLSVFPGATATPIWGDKLERFRTRMMSPESVAEIIVSLYRLAPKDAMVEEIIMRPIGGDLE